MTALAHLDLQPRGKRIDDGSANAVQTAGNLIAAAAELAAGMQNGIHNRHSRQPCLVLHADRHAAAVILHADDVAGQDAHIDAVAIACKRFVDGVIYDFVNKVVQAARTGGADIHARALADGFQTFKDLYLIRIVIRIHMRHFVNIHINSHFPFFGTKTPNVFLCL